MLYNKAIGATASAQKTYIEDVFSTYLYTGTGSTQTITNGIDLSGKGGLVWIKQRSGTEFHRLSDTLRGANSGLRSNSTAAENVNTTMLTAFNTDGFNLGSNTEVNGSISTYTSWTFRKTAKFFDVVTWTGNGSTVNVAHNLGSQPGCIIVKSLNTSGDWYVYHRSLGASSAVFLNLTDASSGYATWDNTTPTSSSFRFNAINNVNGTTFVAYLFAHDAGGFGDSGNDNVISCGSYTGGSGTTFINLGWEAQFILEKNVTSAENWVIVDVQRGAPVGGSTTNSLFANLSSAETAGSTTGYLYPTSTGFADANANSGQTYIYIAIRRGPMKTPADATKVFQAKLYTGSNVDNRLVTTDILTDMVWARQRDDSVLAGMVVGDRLRGQPYLLTGSTAAEVNDSDSFDRQIIGGSEYGTAFSSMTGFWVGNDATSKLNVNTASNNHVVYAFRRAPGFFDVVAYTGTGTNRTVSHNLGVAPEMIIVKPRNAINSWSVYSASTGNMQYLNLNNSNSAATLGTYWNNTTPTITDFTVGTKDDVNANTINFCAYLFATCPGVSKVGSYTGNGSGQNINCGFANGARFVLIKRTDSAGDWYVWDTARGIVSANEPYLLLNSASSEVSDFDLIDPTSTGFSVPGVGATNSNGAQYLFLAIA